MKYKLTKIWLKCKSQISVLNTPGTIDADYRGELKVILINLSSKNFIVEKGLRIAQMVLCPIVKAKLEVKSLENTKEDRVDLDLLELNNL